MKILLIEDDKSQIEMYRLAFLCLGTECLTATDGEVGLRLVKEAQPQLILLDIVMEGMDGVSFLAKVKKDPALRPIPVVVLSNLSKKKEEKRLRRLGAVDFWEKTEVMPSEVVRRALLLAVAS